ncbi:MAG: response regulator transcription factor [Bacteroidetes bacterium]|nr:response regulator transcription factor [Bacteroidota bacterium]
MDESLRLILIFVPLVAGGIGIFLAYQLMRKYPLPFVSSYFYYLVFLYIFGSYSLIGSGILEHMLVSMEADQDAIRSSRLFATLPGIPLLSLSLYALIRSYTEMLSRKIWKLFTIGYFVLFFAGIFLYGFRAVWITRFEQGNYMQFITVQRWVFSGLLIVTYLALFAMSMVFSRKMVHHERRFAQLSGWIYLLYMVLTCTTFLLSGLHEIFTFLFIIFFLSWHLIPIFFMNLYLEKYHSNTSTLQADFEVSLESFSGKFEISKREKEVVQLICKGLSNQEISDALFISLQTVKDHTHRIFNKTGVKNRVQLTNLIRSQ